MDDFPGGLRPTLTPGSQIVSVAPHTWRLSIPAGLAGSYRLAQLDDYNGLHRQSFRWQAGTRFSLEARACQENLPGTWGFGVWNDPFSMQVVNQSDSRLASLRLRLPALPDTAWFFYASPPNYLSLRDDLPAQGWLAAVFQSRQVPAILLTPILVFFPLLLLPPVMKLARRIARKIVKQETTLLQQIPTEWHHYGLTWQREGVHFEVDRQCVLHSQLAPRSKLGLVIWLDNQYMIASPEGRLRHGMLPNPQPAWIEVRNLEID